MSGWIPKKIKNWLLLGFILGVLSISFVLYNHHQISEFSEHFMYESIDEIPFRKVGIVLGTAKLTKDGRINLYFKNRMEAAAQLFHRGKISYIIVSGDNGIKEYNETRDMKEYLMELSVPEDKIIEDFAGFDTLDSVLRTNLVWGINGITIISQPFHVERAIFIARKNDIDAIGYSARKVTLGYSTKTRIREYFARVKCFIDIYVLNSKPKFHKEKEVFPPINDSI